MKVVKVLYFLFFIASSIAFASQIDHDENLVILEYLSGKGPQQIPWSKEHPLYPPAKISQIVGQYKKQDARDIIKSFEDLLTQREFKGLLENNNAIVGTVKSFRLWREALYMVLGRAHYENADIPKSLLYYNAIPETSPFFHLAALEKNWALLAQKKNNDAKQNWEKLGLENSSHYRDEYLLQGAFIHTKLKKYESALSMIEKSQFEAGSRFFYLKNKVMAQALFGKYVLEYKSQKFDKKVDTLNQIIRLMTSLPITERDSDISFMAAEAYWHKASALRLEEPVQYEKEINNNLGIARKWMSPFVEKSLKEKKANLSEEAMFFSIALLWEANQFEEAAVRLKAHTTLFPQGEYLEDAYQMLADYLFDIGDYQNAVIYYRKLAEGSNPTKATYGVYKAAWSFYNLEKKWKALRHFERLVIYYRKNKENDDQKGKALTKESKQDFLLVLAELMSANPAIKELTFLELTSPEELEYKKILGDNYQAIGRYIEAVTLWKNLLDNNPGHEESFQWLVNAGKAYLSAGQRLQIPAIVENYLPRLLINATPQQKDFITEELGKLILTIHREARKSDNKDHWQATDKFYETWTRLMADSKIGDIWYYGAQRMERRQLPWQAVEMFKKASMIKNFKLAEDAALSIIRLTGSANDKLSLVNDKASVADEYKKIANTTGWYIQNFPRSNDLALAEFIHIESLYFSNQKDKAFGFLLSRLNDANRRNDRWNQYIETNRHLYRLKNWQHANELALKVFTGISDWSDENKKVAHKVYQESAFQQAFTLEKEKENPFVIQWYHKAATILDEKAGDHLTSLKAWHNLLLYLHKTGKNEEFQNEYQTFKNTPHANYSEVDLPFEKRELYLNIYKVALKHYDRQKMPYNKIEPLLKAAAINTDQGESEGMRWDALLLAGAYADTKNMTLIMNSMSGSQRLSEYKAKLTLVRLYFYNKMYRQSWDLMSPLINENPDSLLATLLLDFYFTQDAKDIVKDTFVKNKTIWQKNKAFFPVWDDMEKERFSTIIDNVTEQDRNLRLPASVDDTPVEMLKARSNAVFAILNQLQTSKTQLNKNIVEWSPLNSVRLLCQAAKSTADASKRLTELKSPEIKSKQWPEFLGKLENKITELNKSSENEKKVCNETLQKMVFFKRPVANKCFDQICKSDSMDTSEILNLEKNLNGDERLMAYMKNGLWARAEYHIAGIEEKEKRLFYLSLIRRGLGDRYHSASVLKSLQSTPKWRSPASLILADMSWTENNIEARNQFRSVNIKELDSSFMGIYKGLSDKN